METCAICLEEMDQECGECVPLSCEHIFHSKCAVKWLQSGKSSCPICRDDPNRRSLNVESEYIPIQDYRRMMLHNQRLSYNHMRRKHIDPTLKSKYDTLMKKRRIMEEKCRQHKKEVMDMQQEHKDLISRWISISRSARIMRWRKSKSQRLLKRFHKENGSRLNNTFTIVGVEGNYSLSEIKEMLDSDRIRNQTMVSHSSMTSAYPARTIIQDLLLSPRPFFLSRRVIN
jgi:hypothetical protein